MDMDTLQAILSALDLTGTAVIALVAIIVLYKLSDDEK